VTGDEGIQLLLDIHRTTPCFARGRLRFGARFGALATGERLRLRRRSLAFASFGAIGAFSHLRLRRRSLAFASFGAIGAFSRLRLRRGRSRTRGSGYSRDRSGHGSLWLDKHGIPVLAARNGDGEAKKAQVARESDLC